MNIKRFVKKEGILICIVLILIYFTEFTRLEFWIYEHLRLLQTFLAVSASLLIGVYLTRNVLSKAARWSSGSLKKLYMYNKKVLVAYQAKVSRMSKLLFRKISILFKKLVLFVKKYSQELYLMARDIVDVRSAVPEKVTVAESLATTCRKIRSKNFAYKAAAAALSNVLILLFLVKGLRAESNSIAVPDYLELKFLVYKTLLSVYGTLLPILNVASQALLETWQHLTLQTMLIIILATSTVSLTTYLLSLESFRGRMANISSAAYQFTAGMAKKTGKKVGRQITENLSVLQSDTKDIVNKNAWQQIKKEASLLKKELKEELNNKETRKKLFAIIGISLIAIILISGSIDKEDSIWTSFVAATAGQICSTTAGLTERCNISETCCTGAACSKTESGNCYNSTGTDDLPSAGAGEIYEYDANESSCMANWWCDTTDPAGVCDSGTSNDTDTDWYWAFSTTMGYESGTYDSCCGDDIPERVSNCTQGAITNIGDAGYFNASQGCSITGDISCCNANTDCTDPEISTAPSTSYCYTTGTGYNVSGSYTYDHFAYCSSATWYDCDASQSYCAPTGANGCVNATNWPLQGADGGLDAWVASGDGVIGDYNATGAIQCCGDDPNENYRNMTCISGCTSDSTDDACCDASTDCVYSATCISSGGCYENGIDYYCSSGSLYEPDDDSSYCTGCNDLWYSSVSDGSNSPCCGDDSTNDDFYANLTGGSPDVCMYCNDGSNSSAICLGDAACSAAGTMMWLNTTGTCNEGPACSCFVNETCASTGYTNGTGVSGRFTIPEDCTLGGIYDDQYADCFTDQVGDNSTCRYGTTDPCTNDVGLNYIKKTNCADEGNESADGWYCYYDEGCTTSGPNSTCTQGAKRPACDDGVMDGSGADCEQWDSQDGTTDVCSGSATDACLADNNGWDYSNYTDIYSTTCTTCGQSGNGYQLNSVNDECYYAIDCISSGWSGTNESCYDWCWADDLDATTGCFGSLTLINRTEPANATTCYLSRTCTDATNGCGWTTSTMRQDYCDQCGPTETYNSTDYCPNINASCSSSCSDSGTIWYGTDANNITRCSNENTSCVIATDTLDYGDIWTGTSPASCDDTECNLDCTATLGKNYGECISGVCTCNAIPDNPSVTLNFTYANTNYTNESMWCEVYVSDSDTEADMSVDIIIANNTADSNYVEQYALSNAFTSVTEPAYMQFMINETNFTKSDYVICEARLYDQVNYSSWVNSSSLKVENYPVQISSPLGNWSTPSEGSIDEDFVNFTIYWGNNWTDADYNTYETDEIINWTFFMNDTEILGIIMNNDTDTVSIGSLPNATGTVEINWTVIDSSGAEYNETVYWTVNNINDPPNTVTDDYFLEPFHGNATLFNKTITFQWLNTTDPDVGDTLTYDLQVKQCGTTDPSTCNPDTVDFSSFTQEGEISMTGITEGTNITEYISMAEVKADQNYTWRVIAYDGTDYGGWSENWTFYAPSTVILTVLDAEMGFGSMNPNDVNDTTDNSPYPFRIRNDGNVLTDFNITVDTASDWLWDNYQTASSYFQYSIDNATAYSTYSEENASFNWSDSATTPGWFNIPEANTSANVRQLNYSDVMDEVEIDINITVPSDEPAGDKGSTVRITGWVSL